MADASLDQLVMNYALKGIEHWSTAPTRLKTRASTSLGLDIAERVGDIDQAINAWFRVGHTERPVYISMPFPVKQIDQAFFLLIRERTSNAAAKVSFMLFLLVTEDKKCSDAEDRCLAFRWEPPDDSTTTHGYAHVQMCRNALKGEPGLPGIPSWLPDSYPAIPISSTDPVHIFLLMLTSIHGYRMGMSDLLGKLFPNDPSTRKDYLSLLENRLSIS